MCVEPLNTGVSRSFHAANTGVAGVLGYSVQAVRFISALEKGFATGKLPENAACSPYIDSCCVL